MIFFIVLCFQTFQVFELQIISRKIPQNLKKTDDNLSSPKAVINASPINQSNQFTLPLHQSLLSANTSQINQNLGWLLKKKMFALNLKGSDDVYRFSGDSNARVVGDKKSLLSNNNKLLIKTADKNLVKNTSSRLVHTAIKQSRMVLLLIPRLSVIIKNVYFKKSERGKTGIEGN